MNFESELRNGNFLISECNHCKKIVWPSSEFCNQCLGRNSWRKCSRTGKIIEFSKHKETYFCVVVIENSIKLIGEISKRLCHYYPLFYIQDRSRNFMKSELRTLSFLKNKEKKKSKNHRRAAHTRRQRGYHWEDTIVKRFNSAKNWNAFRLGSPSTAVPDVLAVNTQESTIFSIEAKSGTTNLLPVPADQIERCKKWIETFDIYLKRKVILSLMEKGKRSS